MAGGDGANAIENIFCQRRAGDGMDDDIGIGQNVVDGPGDFIGDLTGALEGDVAGEADGNVGEVAVAGAANADAVDFEKSIHVAHGVDDAGAGPGGSGVEKGVDGFARQPGADEYDYAGHKERGDGVGVEKPGDAELSADQHQRQSESNNSARPDVGGEVQGVGL